MKISFLITSDIQIPDHLYNEAAELFLNHLEKHYEEQLLKDGNCVLTSPEIEQKKNVQRVFLRSLARLGQSCPLYYKKGKGLGNVARPYQNRFSGIQ
jgi:hypothetical protein